MKKTAHHRQRYRPALAQHHKNGRGTRNNFEKISSKIITAAGRPAAAISACLLVLLWAISGPVFGFSETWQLIINTTTTIITFLMVFVIQHSQNKDSIALHLKMNELIACHHHASNRLIDVEDLSSEELEVLKRFYVKLSRLAQTETDIHNSHSIDEANRVHTRKKRLTIKEGSPVT